METGPGPTSSTASPLVPPPAPDAASGTAVCSHATAACIPDGRATITWTFTGNAVCLWRATIDWGDGTPAQVLGPATTLAPVTHQYATQGLKTVTITGSGSPQRPGDTCTFQNAVIRFEYGTAEADGWVRTMERLVAQYRVAAQFGPTTLGYYGQLMNLGCAASKSRRPECAAMRPHYVTKDWAPEGGWVKTLLDEIANGADLTLTAARAAAIKAGTEETMRSLYLPTFVRNVINMGVIADARDIDAFIAGGLHFADELAPGFDAAVRDLVASTPRNQLAAAITAFRVQHADLFRYGVVPGFAVELERNELNPAPALFAQAGVPFFASQLREKALKQTLHQRYGRDGAQYGGYTIPASIFGDLPLLWQTPTLPPQPGTTVTFDQLLRSGRPFSGSVQVNPTMRITAAGSSVTSDRLVSLSGAWPDPARPGRWTLGELTTLGPIFDTAPATTLSRPATVSITYETAHLGGVPASQLVILDLDRLVTLPSTVDTATRTVSAPTTHLGAFVLVRRLPSHPFATWKRLIDRQHLDLLGRLATTSEVSTWTTRLATGGQTTGSLVAAIRGSSDHARHVDPIARLYRAYFLRPADAAGLLYWIGQSRSGTGLARISSQFAGSSEFRTLYGSLTNQQFVDRIYRNVLGRAADTAGLRYWTAELDAGRRSRGAVMTGFSESHENRQAHATEVTASVLHSLLLRRNPTPAELRSTIADLDDGLTVTALADRLTRTQEYTARFA